VRLALVCETKVSLGYVTWSIKGNGTAIPWTMEEHTEACMLRLEAYRVGAPVPWDASGRVPTIGRSPGTVPLYRVCKWEVDERQAAVQPIERRDLHQGIRGRVFRKEKQLHLSDQGVFSGLGIVEGHESHLLKEEIRRVARSRLDVLKTAKEIAAKICG